MNVRDIRDGKVDLSRIDEARDGYAGGRDPGHISDRGWSDAGYDELAVDLLCGVVVDEEPEPPVKPLSTAVYEHLRAHAKASVPGNAPRPKSSAATTWPARKGGDAPALTRPTAPSHPGASCGQAASAGSAPCASGAACSSSRSSARLSPGA